MTENQIKEPTLNSPVVKNALLNLLNHVQDSFDLRLARMAEVCASVIATLMLEDTVNPVGLVLIDNPSSGKTTVLSIFYNLPVVYRSDNFTPSSFVSHAANIKKKQLAEVDLLPRIRHKALIVPELAPLFGQKPDELLKSMAVLTRVFDGEGYTSDSGTHGTRGYTGDYIFALIGATTPLSKLAWNTMGQLGSRLLFYTPEQIFDASQRLEKSFADVFPTGGKSFKQKVADCRELAQDLFVQLQTQIGNGKFPRSVSWQSLNDPHDLKWQISIISEFVARARSKVAVWESKSPNADNGKDFAQPILEGPQRLTTILYSLARGHALIHGRTQITEEDMLVVIEVALSSMPGDRRQVIDLMLHKPEGTKEGPAGQVFSSDIQSSLKISRPTAIKIIDELALLGIGSKSKSVGNQPCCLTLDKAFDWLLTEQFARYRQAWREPPGLPF